ncbi:MAG: hypothetical protein PVH31_10650 [Ectothiorhodospiraceae bacterium]|jgi:phenylalanyl-tRNA synthetase alpha chain
MTEQATLDAILRQRDLTNPAEGQHGFQDLVSSAHGAAAELWGCRRQLFRPAPFVVRMAADGHRRVGPRTGIAGALPGILDGLALDPPEDVLMVCPGVVAATDEGVRRHELALIRVAQGAVGSADLGRMVQTVVRALLPGGAYRLLPEDRPGLRQSMRIDARSGRDWITLGHCGLLCPDQLARAGLEPDTHGGLVLEMTLERVAAVLEGSEEPESAAERRAMA